jgi:hypothetical protein
VDEAVEYQHRREQDTHTREAAQSGPWGCGLAGRELAAIAACGHRRC